MREFLIAAAVLPLLIVVTSKGNAGAPPEVPKATLARAAIQRLMNGLEAYYVRHGHYPSPRDGFEALVADGLIDSFPTDPWGSDYGLWLRAPDDPTTSSASPTRFFIASSGEDRAWGTGDDIVMNEVEPPREVSATRASKPLRAW